MICPRCDATIPDTASECSSCGMPTVFMGGADQVATTGEVLEPELLESLDDLDGSEFRGPRDTQIPFRPMGCTLGPGCGCIALPLLALAGVVVSSVIALLWVLSLGRLPAALLELATRARRGFRRS